MALKWLNVICCLDDAHLNFVLFLILFKDGEQLKETKEKVVFEKKGGVRRLLIRSTSVHDEGEYTCSLGDQECSAEVTVIGKLPTSYIILVVSLEEVFMLFPIFDHNRTTT